MNPATMRVHLKDTDDTVYVINVEDFNEELHEKVQEEGDEGGGFKVTKSKLKNMTEAELIAFALEHSIDIEGIEKPEDTTKTHLLELVWKGAQEKMAG